MEPIDCDAEDSDEFEVCEIVDPVGPYDSSSEDSVDDGQSSPMELESSKRILPERDDAFITLRAHKESIFCLAVDHGGTHLASGGQDHVAIVWDLTQRDSVFTTEGHEDSVVCVSFSQSDRYLATGDMAGGVRVWSRPDSRTAPWVFVQSDTVGELLWLAWWRPSTGGAFQTQKRSSEVLAAGDSNGLVTIWSVPQQDVKHVKYLAGSGSPATCGMFYLPSVHTDRPKLAVLYENAEFRLWDVKTAESLVSLQLGSSKPMQDVELTMFSLACPQSEPLYEAQRCRDFFVCGGVGAVHMLVVRQTNSLGSSFEAKCVTLFETGDGGSVETLDFSWTHPFFAFGTVNGTIGIVDTVKTRVRHKWTYCPDNSTEPVGITCLRWSRAAPVLFTCTTHGAVLAWHGLSGSADSTICHGATNPELLAVWLGHESMVLDLVLVPSSSHNVNSFQTPSSSTSSSRAIEPFVVSASDDSTLKVFRVHFTYSLS